MLQALAGAQPFDEGFYRATYPDIAAAVDEGKISDLHQHYIVSGYFEGRFGAPPQVDEAFYTTQYPDIEQAVQRGDSPSGNDHYMSNGAAEGRVPRATLHAEITSWMALLREETGHG